MFADDLKAALGAYCVWWGERAGRNCGKPRRRVCLAPGVPCRCHYGFVSFSASQYNVFHQKGLRASSQRKGSGAGHEGTWWVDDSFPHCKDHFFHPLLCRKNSFTVNHPRLFWECPTNPGGLCSRPSESSSCLAESREGFSQVSRGKKLQVSSECLLPLCLLLFSSWFAQKKKKKL